MLLPGTRATPGWNTPPELPLPQEGIKIRAVASQPPRPYPVEPWTEALETDSQEQP